MSEFVIDAIRWSGLAATENSSVGAIVGGRILFPIGLGAADEAVVVGVHMPDGSEGFGFTRLNALCFMLSSSSFWLPSPASDSVSEMPQQHHHHHHHQQQPEMRRAIMKNKIEQTKHRQSRRKRAELIGILIRIERIIATHQITPALAGQVASNPDRAEGGNEEWEWRVGNGGGVLVAPLTTTTTLRHRALRQPEHVLGEQPLADVVHGQQFPHAPRNVQRVEVLVGVLVHVVAQHLLQLRLHRVALRDERIAEPADHRARWHLHVGRIGEPEMSTLLELKRKPLDEVAGGGRLGAEPAERTERVVVVLQRALRDGHRGETAAPVQMAVVVPGRCVLPQDRCAGGGRIVVMAARLVLLVGMASQRQRG
uniref:Uncharacterized protein n=1 Tax=Anopheles farauti TaxID=69004 RepID=A0A182QAU8_9DIPT